MKEVSREREAKVVRAQAEFIQRVVGRFGPVLGLQTQLAWLGVAEAGLQLAEALELPETVMS